MNFLIVLAKYKLFGLLLVLISLSVSSEVPIHFSNQYITNMGDGTAKIDIGSYCYDLRYPVRPHPWPAPNLWSTCDFVHEKIKIRVACPYHYPLNKRPTTVSCIEAPLTVHSETKIKAVFTGDPMKFERFRELVRDKDGKQYFDLERYENRRWSRVKLKGGMLSKSSLIYVVVDSE